MNLIPRKFYLDDIFDSFLSERDTNAMKCNIYEQDGVYNIELDVPGFDKKDISIECENEYLTITAKKEKESEAEDKNYIHREKSYGSYSRSFYVGNIDSESVNAKFNNGVLTIKFPKEENVTNKKLIEIED